MELLSGLYKHLRTDKRKERFETILEPLQAITQLAMLSFCPPGSKLSISSNLLLVQTPCWNQSIMRTYNQDTRDDLFFLFSVIRRFNKFYGSMKTGASYEKTLFSSLTELGKKGLDQLATTYANAGHTTLIHTLKMYQTLLDKPDAFSDHGSSDGESVDGQERIDEVFVKIREIYSESHLRLMNNIFLLAKDAPTEYETYLLGLNTIMTPTNGRIKTWISDNIVF